MDGISKFLRRLGFPLRNTVWSWGAHSEHGVLLTTWSDEMDDTGHFVKVLGWNSGEHSSSGLKERTDHLRTLWSGGLAGYAVVAQARDPRARRRRILSYDDKNVRAIVSLTARPDGSIWAEIGEHVPVSQLKKHAAKHRLLPGVGEFPVSRSHDKGPKSSAAGYLASLPSMREWLITVARRRGTATYGEARAPFNLRTFEHRHAMDRLGHDCQDAGEPILTSLIIDPETGRCSQGFAKEFRRDDVQEREDCYAYWQMADPAAVRTPGKPPAETMQARAARFARAAVRPEQAAFRRRVFLEYKGACTVTGCTIPEALDAAHRDGRDWRLGHNNGADGLLLRKDIHALYDARLVSIEDGGLVRFHPDVEAHYRLYLSGCAPI
jgi:hypothetical protein